MHQYPNINKNHDSFLATLPKPLIIAGPCAVESLEDMEKYCELLLSLNVHYIRASLFKPRTSPYDFQGLKDDGIYILKAIKEKYPIKIVSEITDVNQLSLLLDYIDVIQIGARNMQNFELLKRIGQTDKIILLKRGFANTIDEWLSACEYIMNNGNHQIILCERGIRTFEKELRNTLDLAGAIYTKQLSHLPVIIDPSHATGKRSLIEPLSIASIASGLDGIMVEIHFDPDKALSDGIQSITTEQFQKIVEKINVIKQVL